MKKAIYFLSLCLVVLLMMRCSNDNLKPDNNLESDELIPLEKSWDLKSLSILQTMKFNMIEKKLKSLTTDQLKTYERDLFLVNEEYRKRPSRETLKKVINLLGFTDVNAYLFKYNSEQSLKKNIFRTYFQNNFSPENISSFKTELSKVNQYITQKPVINATNSDPICQSTCLITYNMCLSDARNAYNTATSGSCSLEKIPGCQPIYGWDVVAASEPNTLQNGCVTIGYSQYPGQFGSQLCGFPTYPTITYSSNGDFRYDFDPSRTNQLLIYLRGSNPINDCNDYNKYNSCLAAKDEAQKNAETVLTLATAKCVNDYYNNCLKSCN